MSCRVIFTDFSTVRVSRDCERYMDSIDPAWSSIVFQHKGRWTKHQKHVLSKWDHIVTAACVLSHVSYLAGKTLKTI